LGDILNQPSFSAFDDGGSGYYNDDDSDRSRVRLILILQPQLIPLVSS
jgi:hypothetical protein